MRLRRNKNERKSKIRSDHKSVCVNDSVSRLEISAGVWNKRCQVHEL